MALKHTITRRGITLADAYIRVYCPQLHPDKVTMLFGVHYFQSADAPLFDAETLYEVPYDLEGGNPLAQAYDHLKTLPEFASAEDV